ncbi:LANO_0H23596g1_1 [Lachancea nothofagi CBS 11611]|uniref:LANO_0H23596g1_1 n=1 Tax=Lachancea nothofagi CBS 11611 TaxID=1266666 RepID=A0A1G4KNZ4_9SACH|nr:LANO_0H23596g1_1 [Lachancea nothofagi CBS 11611]
MPIETDLKAAYSLLYDAKEPEQALELYESILKQSSSNFIAHIYKAACLEKLYYGFKSWHSDETLENALDLLKKAKEIAESRGDRAKLALVNFRLCVHYYNRKLYPVANTFFTTARELGYEDAAVPIWEANLAQKIKKWERKNGPIGAKDLKPPSIEKLVLSSNTTPSSSANISETQPVKPIFKTDWYQSATTVTISLFTSSLPPNKESVSVEISPDLLSLQVTYPIQQTGSEFQFSTKLSHEVDSQQIRISVLTKKLEISLLKKQKIQWKQLDAYCETSRMSTSTLSVAPTANDKSAHSYPSSSKKSTDWSKIDAEDEEKSESADAFFQQLYSNADPDTRRAMMKSFVESNGTALNTNWEEVEKKEVETVAPEGSELKNW